MTPGGRFHVRGPLGAGGEGEVLRARDRELRREVAVKVRRGHGEELTREARTLRSLPPHPNLTRALDDLYDGDDHLLVMDFVDGIDLREALRRSPTPGLPPREVLHHLTGAAAALDHLHAQDPPLAHGDVKPANVVVTTGRRHRVVLVDLGLTGESGDVKVEGTGAYSPPEVGTSGRSPRGDVFSLAATAHALLTGTPPEPGMDPDWSGVPADRAERVRAVLGRGLSVAPELRHPSASALVQDLAAALGDLPAPARRWKPLAAAAGLAVVATLATLGNDPAPPPSASRVSSAPLAPAPQVPAPTVGPTASASPSPVAVVSAVLRPTVLRGGEVPRPLPVDPLPTVAATRTGYRLAVVWTDRPQDIQANENFDVRDIVDGAVVQQHHNFIDPLYEVFHLEDDHIMEYLKDSGFNRVLRVQPDGTAVSGHHLIGLADGFTELVALGDGWFWFSSHDDGSATVLRYDREGNYLAEDKLDGQVASGFDAAVRLRTGVVLLYRRVDGATAVVDVTRGFGSARVGPALPLGLAVLCDDMRGHLVGVDAAGTGHVLAGDDDAVTEVASFWTARPWTRCKPALGGVLLSDDVTGLAELARLDLSGQPLDQLSFTAPPHTRLAYIGPRP